MQGSLNSTANTTFRIEVFASSAADTSGYGEGQRWLGSFDVTTDGGGNVNFTQTLSVSVAAGEKVSATATNLTTNDTSEFALCTTAVMPGITVTPTSGLTTTEAGGTAQFTVVLATRPTANVTINLSSSDTTEGTVSTSSLTFTPDDWDVARTVTVTGVDDTFIDGNIAYTVVTSAAISTDPDYPSSMNPSDVSLTNTDGEGVVGFRYNTIWVTTNADVVNGTTTSIAATYANPGPDGISLREAMTAAGNTANGADGPDRIYFNLPDIVLADGTHVLGDSHMIVVSDTGDHRGLPVISQAVIIDATTDPYYNQTIDWHVAGNPVVELDGENINVASGNKGTGFTVGCGGNTIRGFIINRYYTSGITINNSNNTIQACFIGTDRTGTYALANRGSGISIANNGITIGGTNPGDGCLISGNLSTGIYINGNNCTIQGNYIGVNSTGNAALPNGSFGIQIASGKTGTTIGGTAAGAGNVISGNNSYGIQISGSSITVAGNYIGVGANGTTAIGNANHGILVDGSANNNTIGGTGTGAGNTIANNTGDGVRVTSSSNYGTAILSNRIYANGGLGINLVGGVGELPNGVTPNDPDGGDNDLGANNLQNFPVLTSATTNSSSLIRITGTLNSLANRTYRIEFFTNTAADASGYGEGQTCLGYTEVTTDGSGNASFLTDISANVAPGTAITATATDWTATNKPTSEFALVRSAQNVGIVVTPTSGLTTTEDGGTAQFSVVLNGPPTSDVTIGISSSNTSEGTVPPSPLTFTTANWSNPQTVTITGVDDNIVDGDIAYTISTAAAASSDTLFNGLNPSDVTVTNINTDTAGIIVNPLSLTTNENGHASFTVVLNSKPSANVTVNLSSSDTTEGTLSKSSLTFTASNWNVAQTVTVTGVDDYIVDGDITYTIVTSPAISTDVNYNGLNASDVSVTNVNTNVAGFTVTPTSNLITTEAGRQANFTIVLNTKPEADVTINLSSSDETEGSVSVPSVTFTPDNWNVAQTLTITGVGDGITDGNAEYNIITSNAISLDGVYNGMEVSDVSVTNLDSGTPYISVIPGVGLTTTEDGGQATFFVILNSRPDADVTVDISSSDLSEGNLSTGTLLFTPDDWDQDHVVTITGVNDDVVDGNMAYSIITDSSVSDDPKYNGLNPLDVSVTNIDNDDYNTVYVDTASDVVDGSTTSLTDLIHNKGDDGKISLREAILAANNTPNGVGGPDRICFNIPGSGVHTISPGSVLPSMTDVTILDATTQSGYAGTPLIEINGSAAGDYGLKLSGNSGGSTIKGFTINGCANYGVWVQSNDNTVSYNWIGTDNTGILASPNRYGVYVTGGGNDIMHNVISGNTTGTGVYISSSLAIGNTVAGNYIGTDAAGTAPLANNYGVRITSGAIENIIGGTNPADRNIISGNASNGIYINSASNGNIIEGNYLGARLYWRIPIANVGSNIYINGSNNTVIGAPMRAT